jgi:hypothetical protein
MAENSNTNPQVRDKNTPLQTLVHQALRRDGVFEAGTISGDVALMFIEFANIVVDEVRSHPYHDGSPLDYYVDLTDARDIPDPIIVAGLLWQYALQQGSERISFYMPSFYKTMNQLMWYRMNGNTALQMRVVDNGTSPRNSQHVTTSAINGLTGDAE